MQEIKKPNFVKNKKLVKTTMFATTLLVAIALLFSSGASMTIVNEEKISVNSFGNNQERSASSASSNSGVTFQEAPSILEQTNKPMGGYNPDRAEAILTYSGTHASNVGLTAPGTWEGAARFTPTELSGYNGWWIKKVQFYHYASYSSTHDGSVKIYGNGTASSPGSLLSQTPFTVTGTGYNLIELDAPVIIDETSEYWISVEWEQLIAPDYPMGADGGPAVLTKGDWIGIGGTWSELAPGINRNWEIEGVISDVPPPVNDTGVKEIILPQSGPASSSITPKAMVKNFGSAAQTSVPVPLSINRFGTPATLFTEGFEYYVPDQYLPPSGWTLSITNPNATWFAYVSGTTTRMWVDEDTSGGLAQDEWLFSPNIDCSLFSEVYLTFTKYFYYSSGDSVGWVYLSNDSGVTWNVLRQYTSSSSTAENINISVYAAGVSTVQIAFRFESTAESVLYDYFYIDNFWVGDPYDWGTYGDNPPPGWTIINGGDTADWSYHEWYRYSYSSYDCSGYIARTYYSDSGYEDRNESLISPTINCAALTTVTLSWAQYCYVYTSTSSYYGFATVEGSIDGGATWPYMIVNHTSSSHYTQTYDISSWAAGESNVKIMFRYESFLPKYGYYWNVDNIRVGDSTTTVFFENFDGTTIYSCDFNDYIYIPDDWGTWSWNVVTGTDPENKWQNVDAGTLPTCSPAEGTRMALYQAASVPDGEQSFLYSSAYNVASAVTLKMNFQMYHDSGDSANPYDKIEVLASHDGITWQTMDTFYRYDASDPGWVTHTVDLTGYEDDTALQVGFLATSDYGYNMYIDDMALFDPGLIPEYTNTQYVNLDPYEVKEVVFLAWSPGGWQNVENTTLDYDVSAKTILTGDEDSTNDAKGASFSLDYPFLNDVQVIAITDPKGMPKEDFTGLANGELPEGWYRTHTNWGAYSTSNAGGAAPELRFSWTPSSTATFRCYSGPYDTTGMTELKMSFKHYIDYYTATTPVYYKVEGSADGTTWASVWELMSPTANVGPETLEVTFTSAEGIGSSTWYFSFTFDGYSLYTDYWYIDDVLIQTYAKPFPVKAVIENIGQNSVRNFFVVAQIGESALDAFEYDESVAVSAWLDPGDTLEIAYPDEWIPANLISPQASGEIEYDINVATQLGNDSNTGNDQISTSIKLSYVHDIFAQEITQPSIGRSSTTVLSEGFEGGVMPPAGWTHIQYNTVRTWQIDNYDPHSGTYYANCLYDETYSDVQDEWMITPSMNFSGQGYEEVYLSFWWLMSYYWGVNPYDNYDCNVYITTDNGTTWDLLFNEDSYTFTSWTWIDTDMGTHIDLSSYIGEPDVKIGFQYEGWDGAELAIDDILIYAEGGAPAVDIFVPAGVQEFEATFGNAGTFDESDVPVNATLFDYTDPLNPVLIYGSETDIDIDAGTSEPVDFGSYDFTDEGIYKFRVLTDLEDDNTDNNEITIGLGVDNTPPESTHTLTPGTPDGSNGWYVSDVKVKLEAEDPEVAGVSSGVDVIKYKIDTGSEQTYTGEITISADGEHTVYYYAIDNVGNAEAQKSVNFKIDQGSPEIALSYEVTGGSANAGYTVVWTATASDEMSGMDKVEFYFMSYLQDTVSGPGPTYTWTITNYNPDLEATFKVIGYDMAGNTAEDSIKDPDPRPNNNNYVNGVSQPIVKTVKINLGR